MSVPSQGSFLKAKVCHNGSSKVKDYIETELDMFNDTP
jgi:hypothetical protein